MTLIIFHHTRQNHEHTTLWHVLIYLLFNIITNPALSQNISIHQLNTINQLPVNAVHRIFQDHEGYIWYGTVDGLCRDDGYNVCVFRSDMYTPGIIDNNLILCINEDNNHRIWFGTEKGAYYLDKKDYVIHRVDEKRLKNAYIDRLDRTADGTMWIACRGRLLHYKDSGQLIRSYSIQCNGTKMILGGFYQDSKGDIIITYFNNGIYHIDRSTNKIVAYPNPKGYKCASIFKDLKHDYYWLMTWGQGILRFNPKAKSTDEMYIAQPIPVTGSGEPDGTILYCIQDKDIGYLWCTTKKDLVAFSQDNKGMLHQVDLSYLIPSSNKMLNEIIRDNHGNLWISAFDRPSFMINFLDNKPADYPLPALMKRVKYAPAIMAISDAGNGVMWISQERVGLFLYNLYNNAISSFSDFSYLKDKSIDEIRVMAGCKNGNGVWIAPDYTTNIYLIKREGMRMLLSNTIKMPSSITPTSVKSLHESSSGLLWIGASNRLFSYDIKRGYLKTIISDCGTIYAISEDGNGNIWLCSGEKGLYKYSTEGQIFHYYDHQGMTAISVSNDGNVWIGTEHGELKMFDPHKKIMTDYSQACNLNGNQINQVVVDMYNHIWIDTNSKIIEFNPRNGSYQTYLTTDGSSLLWRLLPSTLCRAHDGRIFVGGIPGIKALTPSARLERDGQSVKTTITNVKVMDKSIFFGTYKYTESPQKIIIDNNDHNIDIEFSTLNHRYAYKTRYAYRLIGVDKDWIYTGDGHNSAFYNSLQKGTYIFQVKATDENGLWSNKITEMEVVRKPAFYETWYAYTFYVLIIFGALLYSIRYYLKRFKVKNEELWADSKEMIRMRDYLDEREVLSGAKSVHLDKILIDKALKTVNENISESDFDVNALAVSMNMSRSTLTRKLKTITGQTPLEFIRGIKMKKACKMLIEKDKNISEIATYLGYYDRKYFTSCFKDVYGMTPSEYQKEHQQKG
jgi:ligand-binding sensor domain-containing protein/AraC-like DNA-binding protein